MVRAKTLDLAIVTLGRVAVLSSLGFALAGCDAGARLFKGKSATELGAESSDGVPQATSVKLVDRDVEAPEVFQVTDQALWDGRPSLGGVWVASPDAVDPERVILRNTVNGKFVIGALFRRERENPGPPLQISSDAAAALGLLAGQPASLQVTALRREEVAASPPDATKPILDAAESIATTPLDTAAIASAAIDKAEGKPASVAAIPPATDPTSTTAGVTAGTIINDADLPAAQIATQPPVPAPEPAAQPAASSDPLIQVGIFSVEANAKRAVDTLAKSGVTAAIRREETQGKAFWSVTARGNSSVLASVKAAGFADAYVLKR